MLHVPPITFSFIWCGVQRNIARRFHSLHISFHLGINILLGAPFSHFLILPSALNVTKFRTFTKRWIILLFCVYSVGSLSPLRLSELWGCGLRKQPKHFVTW
jgi:uncharacterized protein YhhL (DUF1145 family)